MSIIRGARDLLKPDQLMSPERSYCQCDESADFLTYGTCGSRDESILPCRQVTVLW